MVTECGRAVRKIDGTHNYDGVLTPSLRYDFGRLRQRKEAPRNQKMGLEIFGELGKTPKPYKHAGRLENGEFAQSAHS